MKTSTTKSVLLGLLFALATMMMVSQAALEMKVREGGLNFKIGHFDDGRSTPYRVYFWDQLLTGSTYRFDENGDVVYFKAASTVFYDRQESVDGSLAFRSKDEGEDDEDRLRRLLSDDYSNDGPNDFANVDCFECSITFSAVCAHGLVEFCEGINRGALGTEGRASVDILCDNYEGVCATAMADCDSICTDPDDDSPKPCSNDVAGVESADGMVCCDAGCGACGGSGCARFGADAGLSAYDCCVTTITESGDSCTATGKAPCYIYREDDSSENNNVQDDNCMDDSSDDDSSEDDSDDDRDDHDPPVCSNGVDGVESPDGKVCCVAECEACGGAGCSSFGANDDLDERDCCSSTIRIQGHTCSDTGEAPCNIDRETAAGGGY